MELKFVWKKKKKLQFPVQEVEHEYYKTQRLWYDIKMRAKHSDGIIHKEKIMSTITLKYGPKNFRDWQEGKSRHYFERKDVWTDRSTPELIRLGYKKTEGLYDNIIWWGVPVYCKIENMRIYDGSKIMEDGMPEISGDTATTLNDFLHSNADHDFIKGMGKKSVSPMDMQKLGMMAMVGVAAVLGLWMLGVF